MGMKIISLNPPFSKGVIRYPISMGRIRLTLSHGGKQVPPFRKGGEGGI